MGTSEMALVLVKRINIFKLVKPVTAGRALTFNEKRIEKCHFSHKMSKFVFSVYFLLQNYISESDIHFKTC